MNRVIALSLTFLTTCIAAFGNTFYGTITQTITSTNDPQFHVGQTFTGYYSYESGTIDGFYCAPSHWYPTTPTNLSLSGTLYVPFADEAHFEWTPTGMTSPISYTLAWGDRGSYSTFDNTPINPGKLVIENGRVTDFSWSFDMGGFFMWATKNDFQALSYYDRGPFSQVPNTRGTFFFGNPVCVPDLTSTLPLLAGALLGFGLIRRRFGS